ncbi:MAG TPA: 50S ribosomal protein L10 [Candidatus Goldiibacteriota bacterium]|nr:50S ribosomal protein L10 [Candidatus Goldiibacteriota bacterium]
MAQKRVQKTLIVKEAVSKIRESAGIIVTSYQGLTASQVNKLRRELEKVGAQYKVLKNTLTKRALDELQINSNFKSLFTGVTGLVFSTDYVSAVKVLASFEKENEAFKIKGGYIDQKSCSEADIREISKLSSKGELIGKLVNIINSPIQRLVNVLNGPQRNLVCVLSAVEKTKK